VASVGSFDFEGIRGLARRTKLMHHWTRRKTALGERNCLIYWRSGRDSNARRASQNQQLADLKASRTPTDPLDSP
jgi:hypothetical protein